MEENEILQDLYNDIKSAIDPVDFNAENVIIDIDAIGIESKDDAMAMVKNLSKLYYDEEFMRTHPEVKKRIDTELESLRVLLKMRKADECAHDSIIKAISANNANASLYRSLTDIQKTILAITTKMDDVIKGLNTLLKGFQLEINFDKPADDQAEVDDQTSGLTRGSRDFIKGMIEKESMKGDV